MKAPGISKADSQFGWGHLRGYAVATEPAEPALKLLIAGFRNEKELEVFVLRLRGMGLLTLCDVEGPTEGELNGEPGAS